MKGKGLQKVFQRVSKSYMIYMATGFNFGLFLQEAPHEMKTPPAIKCQVTVHDLQGARQLLLQTPFWLFSDASRFKDIGRTETWQTWQLLFIIRNDNPSLRMSLSFKY